MLVVAGWLVLSFVQTESFSRSSLPKEQRWSKHLDCCIEPVY